MKEQAKRTWVGIKMMYTGNERRRRRVSRVKAQHMVGKHSTFRVPRINEAIKKSKGETTHVGLRNQAVRAEPEDSTSDNRIGVLILTSILSSS